MKRSVSSLVLSLVLALPVAGNCSPQGGAPAAGPAAGSALGGAAMAVNTGVSGKVLQTLNGGEYTYVQLEKDQQKAWVACPVTKLKVGEELNFRGCTPQVDFHSKTLNRTFERIMFCGPALSSSAVELLSKKSTGSEGLAPVAKEKIVVEGAKGANAHTVAECYAKSGELNNKPVVVKGKVMKVSSGIMRRTWIHLQDGTGSSQQKNNDLVVTTSDTVSVGETVTIQGVLAKNKDFGSGYKYQVIVEQAKITK